MSMLKSIQPYDENLKTETDNIANYFGDVVITSCDYEKENYRKFERNFKWQKSTFLIIISNNKLLNFHSNFQNLKINKIYII